MSYIGNQPTSVAFVTDSFSGNGTTTAFTMSVAPANTASVLVAISGVLQDPATYSVSGNTLTFTAAPPTGTGNISARFLGVPASNVTTTAYRTVTEFTATASQTTFTPPSYTAGFINVYRNGVLLGSTDYTATNGTTVVLASGATAGDLITVESFLVSSVLNAIPATTGSVGSTYLAGGAALANIGTGGVTQSYIGTNVAGTGPAFSAYAGATTSVANATYTKVAFNTKEFDTNSNYDTTLSRFTPTVAGYYQVNGSIWFNTGITTNSLIMASLYKNGTAFKQTVSQGANGSGYFGVVMSTILYMNGTTDYIELWCYQGTGSTQNAAASQASTYFQASMVRSA